MSRDRTNTSRTKRLCVLLLEDDDADAYLTSRVLLGLPRIDEVIRVRNGQQAIEPLQSGRTSPDIAFVDLQMPTMGGLDFLATCMDQGLAKVPLIVLTSSSDWKDTNRSRVQGALWVITKPDDPADLKVALQEALDAFVPDESAEVSASAWLKTPNADGTKTDLRTTARLAPAAGPQFGRRQARPA